MLLQSIQLFCIMVLNSSGIDYHMVPNCTVPISFAVAEHGAELF